MQQALKQPEDLALWRFGIISPLLHSRDGDPSLRAKILDLSGRTFFTPRGSEKLLSPDTIRNWLYRYRTAGIDGLRDKPRNDRGDMNIPSVLQLALTELRKEQPQWTVKRMLSKLREEGIWTGRSPSKSSLYRFTKAQGLGRNADQEHKPVRPFEFPFFGDLWSADFLHGPKIRCGTHVYKTYLHAIIDDATRYIVVARFHLSEDTRSLLDDLMLALRRFGIPKRFYTDNGAAFRSHHLRMVAAKLGVALPHTPPYTPRGRGKIERFFRTVRDGFLTGRERSSLDKLNADFSAWISQYHQKQHSTLGMSPLERKLADAGPELKQISATQNIDDIFRMEQLKRVGSDGCVRMFKKRFEVPDAVPGSQVVIYYLPWDQNHIFIGESRSVIKPVDTVKNALRYEKPRRGTDPNPQENRK